ncbi:hypothetical protein M9434_007181 [Picochlorum sp. BPE23]|nr:hypothetical protein M9434_007181 [Picochlorum sp. BPE23]
MSQTTKSKDHVTRSTCLNARYYRLWKQEVVRKRVDPARFPGNCSHRTGETIWIKRECEGTNQTSSSSGLWISSRSTVTEARSGKKMRGSASYSMTCKRNPHRRNPTSLELGRHFLEVEDIRTIHRKSI